MEISRRASTKASSRCAQISARSSTRDRSLRGLIILTVTVEFILLLVCAARALSKDGVEIVIDAHTLVLFHPRYRSPGDSGATQKAPQQSKNKTHHKRDATKTQAPQAAATRSMSSRTRT